MSLHAIAAVLGFASLVAAQTPTPAPPAAGADLPVSIARIRDALKRPAPLRLPPTPRSDFKVDVTETQRFRDLLDLIDFGGGASTPGGWLGYQRGMLLGQRSQPLVSFDGAPAVAGAISKARRARAEQLAREEVERALIQYCTTHECPAR
jgi:hypothetical protein